MDNGDVVEDNSIKNSAMEVVDSDQYPPFFQVINQVWTVSSVGRSSDAVAAEKGKSNVVVDVAFGQATDGQTSV